MKLLQLYLNTQANLLLSNPIFATDSTMYCCSHSNVWYCNSADWLNHFFRQPNAHKQLELCSKTQWLLWSRPWPVRSRSTFAVSSPMRTSLRTRWMKSEWSIKYGISGCWRTSGWGEPALPTASDTTASSKGEVFLFILKYAYYF